MANCASEAASSHSTASEIRYMDQLGLYKTEKPYEVPFLPVKLQDIITVESIYHAEAQRFLKSKYGAKKVFIFDSTIREMKPPPRNSSAMLKNQQKLGPAGDCHVDQSPGRLRSGES
ncbi:hypothetical protein B0T26DRAFT_671513 [Lasiosphaeria miniovina]|uniref:Uncharacterized protein n=1 Tax=Lasiosphaeria miniovina TaxID=1954250 RepID=A0AA40B346_9PEZI|nr:uncharacterized protein B0T26DRAFT_671513 [Lasiosphaeria miniovina]KAK0726750.1 hypothetical protein B0T26DRAFT_671513 [Lasiosphaeria miniovina]